MNRKYRKTIIAGNWKMNNVASDVKPFLDELKTAMTQDGKSIDPATVIPG